MRSNFQAIKDELQDNEAIELCALQCGTIGDTTKLKICYLLRHYPELNVTTIAEFVSTSVSNASHSLNKLRAARLVKSRRCGQTICYSLQKDAFANVMNIIGSGGYVSGM
jgi:DNA-binding transcriptional ArsR family regulator